MQGFSSQWVTVISRRTMVCPLPRMPESSTGSGQRWSWWGSPGTTLAEHHQYHYCFFQLAVGALTVHRWPSGAHWPTPEPPVRPGHHLQARQPWDVLLTASGHTKVLVGQYHPSPLPLLPTLLGAHGHCLMVVGMGTGGKEEEVLLDACTGRAVDGRWSSVCSRQALGSHVSNQLGWNGPKLGYSVQKAVSSGKLSFSAVMTGCIQWLQICLCLSERMSLCCFPARAAEQGAGELCEMQVVGGNRSCRALVPCAVTVSHWTSEGAPRSVMQIACPVLPVPWLKTCRVLVPQKILDITNALMAFLFMSFSLQLCMRTGSQGKPHRWGQLEALGALLLCPFAGPTVGQESSPWVLQCAVLLPHPCRKAVGFWKVS